MTYPSDRPADGSCTSCPRPSAGVEVDDLSPQSVVDFMHCLACKRARRREQYMLDQMNRPPAPFRPNDLSPGIGAHGMGNGWDD